MQERRQLPDKSKEKADGPKRKRYRPGGRVEAEWKGV